MKTKKPNPYEPKKKVVTYSKFASKAVKLSNRIDPVVKEFVPRQTERPQSLNTFGGVGSKKEALQYTGDQMLGISIIHKSCLQPVFSQQQAIENASMRR